MSTAQLFSALDCNVMWETKLCAKTELKLEAGETQSWIFFLHLTTVSEDSVFSV